jgi:hypothetical protein
VQQIPGASGLKHDPYLWIDHISRMILRLGLFADEGFLKGSPRDEAIVFFMKFIEPENTHGIPF